MSNIHNKALLLCEQEKREEALVNAATAIIDKLEARKECLFCLRPNGHDLDCAVGDLKAALR